MGLRRARRALYQLDYLPAHFGDSAADSVLSLALFGHVGVGFLSQLKPMSTANTPPLSHT
jgi:hypothetical protein